MEKKDLKDFALILASLGEVFETGKDISEVRAELYFQTLKEYDIKQIKMAASKLLKAYKFNSLPKPADFVEAIEGAEGDLRDKAMLAWMEVMKSLDGPYPKELKFEDSYTMEAIRALGGWNSLLISKNIQSMQKDFVNFYSALVKRETSVKMLGEKKDE